MATCCLLANFLFAFLQMEVSLAVYDFNKKIKSLDKPQICLLSYQSVQQEALK